MENYEESELAGFKELGTFNISKGHDDKSRLAPSLQPWGSGQTSQAQA